MAQYDLILTRNDHVSGTEFTELRIAKPDVTGKFFTQHPTTGVLSWSNVDWSNLTGKPSTFTPSAHAHTIADVTDLQTALNGKEPSFSTLAVNKGGTGVATITGLIKGNGTAAMAAAVAGTDYVVPSGSITGNAATATKLANARTINGTSFDGSANITISAVDSTARIAASEKGAVNGVATLDASGLVPSNQLPSYVDDVVEYANLAAFPGTGESGKIYIAIDTLKTYRWSGSIYTFITSGAVDSVAGKTGVVTLVKADVGLGSVDNTADSTKAVASAAKWTTARSLSFTGDATGTGSVDGSANASFALTLANIATAGTYGKVTINAKGLVTAGAALAATDIPVLDAAKVTTGTFDAARIPSLAISKITDLQSALNAKLEWLGSVPSTISTTGTIGQIAVSTNFIYVCTATNTWKRSPLSSWAGSAE